MKAKLYLAIILCIAFTNVGFSQIDLGDDITTCEGETVTLDATTTNATSYQWTLNGQVIPGESASTLQVTQSGQYGVNAIVNGVPESDSIIVTFTIPPNVNNIFDLVIDNTTGNGSIFEIFDLTSLNPFIIGTNAAASLNITFYESVFDAFDDVNPIANPTSYQNIASPQTMFVRVVDLNTGCVTVGNFDLVVRAVTQIQCNASPLVTTYCYTNNDFTQFIIRSVDNVSPVRVEFLAGGVEFAFDNLVVIDSDGTTIYQGNGNNGDLTGLVFESTGDEITIGVDSDFSVSCGSTAEIEPWEFTASCVDASSVGIITAETFLDANNNGVFDSDEIAFPFGNISYELNDNGEINVGAANDAYFIISDDANNLYDFTFSFFDGYENCYNVTTPTIDDVSVAIGETLTIRFPITEQQPCEDLAVVLLNPSTPPRPGFMHRNTVYLTNASFSNIASGTVTIDIDDDLVYSGVTSINPNYVVTTTATGISIDFVNLTPYTTEIVELDLMCPVAVPLGELVTNIATYTTDSNDTDLANNSSELSEVVIGSWDPNDIRESRGPKIVHPEFTSNDYLYYTIRFQNLGTAEAINVRIEETLDTQLDETTFQMLTSSHGYQVTRTNDELVWNFDNINLPAEMFDAEGSNGFVYFRIKPKTGYAIGDIVPASAGIYFDFNAPVITNTFETEFIAPLSVDELANSQIKIYPNPAKDRLYVALDKSEQVAIQLIDIHGKQVLNTTENTKDIELNVSNLQSGIYFLKLSSDTRQFTKKIMVN